jgi:hypothetical protein
VRRIPSTSPGKNPTRIAVTGNFSQFAVMGERVVFGDVVAVVELIVDEAVGDGVADEEGSVELDPAGGVS